MGQRCERLFIKFLKTHVSCLIWFETRLWEQKWPAWPQTNLEQLIPDTDTCSGHCWTPGTWNRLLVPSAPAGAAWKGNEKVQLAWPGCLPWSPCWLWRPQSRLLNSQSQAQVLPVHPVDWAGHGFLGAFRLKQRLVRAGGEEPWSLVPPLPQTHCVTSGKSQPLSGPHFPQIWSEMLDDKFSEGNSYSSFLSSIYSSFFWQQLPSFLWEPPFPHSLPMDCGKADFNLWL